MILEPVLGRLPVRSGLPRLVVGCALAALAVSLGTVGVLRLLHFEIDAVIPAVLGALAAAAFAAKSAA